jgi:hypothetical protein
MVPVHFFRKRIFIGTTVALFCFASMALSVEKAEESTSLSELDFNACDPARFQAKITEASPVKGTLSVAEKEIRLMDVVSNGRRLSTALLNVAGKPEPLAAFKKGDLVLIEGFAHPKGFVVALKIQKIKAVIEKKKSSYGYAGRTPKINGEQN